MLESRCKPNPGATIFIILMLLVPSLKAQDSKFHNAPSSAAAVKNPYAGQRQALEAGKRIYVSKCSSCHGEGGEGTGNIPALTKEPTQSAQVGEVFWYISRGDANNGMPSWAGLPRQQRWQVVTYLKSLGASQKASDSSIQ